MSTGAAPSRPASDVHVARLAPGDGAVARRLFRVMADAFEEEPGVLSDAYVGDLLARDAFWVLAARLGDEVVGGLTAHVLPMTRSESREVFIYDLAVHPDHQRRGIGRALMGHLEELAREAGAEVCFVPADDEDLHALEFYRALGWAASPVTFFTSGEGADGPDMTTVK